MNPSISDDDFDALMARIPASYTSRAGGTPEVHPRDLIIEAGPLTAAHLQAIIDHEESDTPLDVRAPLVKSLRHSHHRLAQLLASGLVDIRAAALCNMTPNRVSVLKQDPAFRDLIAHYAKNAEEEYTDFHTAAAALGLDALGELQSRLDEEPEKFSISGLMELVKTTADRTGNGPMAKNLNVNLNADLGNRLERARKRALEAAQSSLTDT